MKSPLLNKPKNFNQAHQLLVLRIQAIKRKNDQYQRLTGQEIDPAMAQEILQEKHIMDKEVDDTKRFIQELEQTLKEQQQKNRLKQTKKQYEKQTGRYKLISETLMEKSTIRAQMRDSVRRNSTQRNRNSRDDRHQQTVPNRQSTHLFKQQQLDHDMDFQQNLIKGRKKDLITHSQKLEQIYGVVQDMAKQVSSQGQMIDVIDANMLQAQGNVQATNQQLNSAQKQQKKAKKKYIIIVCIILFLLLCGGGVIFFTSK